MRRREKKHNEKLLSQNTSQEKKKGEFFSERDMEKNMKQADQKKKNTEHTNQTETAFVY